MKDILKLLILIYLPDKIDWLGFERSKKNPYTYHHLIPLRNGGETTKNNGCILTLQGHKFFNELEQRNPEIAKELNDLFKKFYFIR